jgi:phosphate transport system substrate-binding protein
MSTAASADIHPARRRRTDSKIKLGAVLAITALGLLALLAPSTIASASPSLNATGSSFAGIAMQQWVGQSATLFGLNINWQVSSSVIGLNNFAQNQLDFAASDIPYSSGQASSTPTQPYQYMPDVAGALAFMYNLTGNNGQQITSLVLDAQVIEQIFTGQITTWNSPTIAQLNPQLQGDLPTTTILPVYREDASGENYLLSDYLLYMNGSSFTQYQQAMQSAYPGEPSATWPTPVSGETIPPGYPGWTNGNPVGQNGSDNAADYVSAASSNGGITYVETAYAIEHNEPVASIINQSGNAVQPTSENDATALEKAILYSDLTQNLTGVYTNPLPNAYPVSSYSYLVTPCSPTLAAAQKTKCSGPPGTSTFPDPKGQALGQFVAFLACAGQQKMALLGYSPLPPNLVQEDFDAIGRLNGGQEPAPVSAANCDNPYVDGQIPLPGEPKLTGGGPPNSNPVVAPPGGTSGSGGGSSGPGGASNGAGSKGSGTTTGSGAGTGGTASGTGGSVNGKGGSSTKGGTERYSSGGHGGGGSAVSKYLAAHKAGPEGGSTSFLRADQLQSAATSALGLSSPVVRITIWCLVVAAGIFVPVLFLGRMGRRKRKTGIPAGAASGSKGMS